MEILKTIFKALISIQIKKDFKSKNNSIKKEIKCHDYDRPLNGIVKKEIYGK